MSARPGDEIRRARKALGMSQAALGAAAGVDSSTVGRIERGIGDNPSKLGALQAYLGLGPYADPSSKPMPDLRDLTDQQLVDLMSETTSEVARRLVRNNGERRKPATYDPARAAHGAGVAPRTGQSRPTAS